MTPMNPRVTHVIPQPGHQLELTFANGEVKRFDMRPYLGTGIFSELKDEDLFMTARASLGTVVWGNGADLCPDTLYLGAEALVMR